MKRGAPSHPKTRRLARRLGLPLYATVGILELLWHFTAQFARRGDVGRYSDEDLAEATAWDRAPSELIDALVAEGWLDRHEEHRLVVHDWSNHADEAVKKALLRAGESFADGGGLRVRQRPTASASASDNVGLPEPEPEPEPVPVPEPEPQRREPPEWALAAAERLAVAVRRRWPGAVVPESFVAWARKIAGIRGAAREDVEALLAWYCAEERDGPGGGIAPYTPEVRSGASFAEKWNALVAARDREGREVKRLSTGAQIKEHSRRLMETGW